MSHYDVNIQQLPVGIALTLHTADVTCTYGADTQVKRNDVLIAINGENFQTYKFIILLRDLIDQKIALPFTLTFKQQNEKIIKINDHDFLLTHGHEVPLWIPANFTVKDFTKYEKYSGKKLHPEFIVTENIIVPPGLRQSSSTYSKVMPRSIDTNLPSILPNQPAAIQHAISDIARRKKSGTLKNNENARSSEVNHEEANSSTRTRKVVSSTSSKNNSKSSPHLNNRPRNNYIHKTSVNQTGFMATKSSYKRKHNQGIIFSSDKNSVLKFKKPRLHESASTTSPPNTSNIDEDNNGNNDSDSSSPLVQIKKSSLYDLTNQLYDAKSALDSDNHIEGRDIIAKSHNFLCQFLIDHAVKEILSQRMSENPNEIEPAATMKTPTSSSPNMPNANTVISINNETTSTINAANSCFSSKSLGGAEDFRNNDSNGNSNSGIDDNLIPTNYLKVGKSVKPQIRARIRVGSDFQAVVPDVIVAYSNNNNDNRVSTTTLKNAMCSGANFTTNNVATTRTAASLHDVVRGRGLLRRVDMF